MKGEHLNCCSSNDEMFLLLKYDVKILVLILSSTVQLSVIHVCRLVFQAYLLVCVCVFFFQVKSKVRRVADEDDDWTPHHTEDTEGDEEEEEGENEGTDCILRERPSNTAEEMDTIARSVTHSYHLRSLHKPEVMASIRGPTADLQVPLNKESGGSESHPLKVGVFSKRPAPLPVPILPPPPMPRGQSAADLYQSLDTRDEEIRKSRH